MSTDIIKITAPQTFEEGVDKVASIQAQMKANLMLGYWHTGNIIAAMEKNEGKYGSRVIHRVSEMLSEKGQECGIRILQDAHKFFKLYPEEKNIKQLIEKSLDWSQAREIIKLEKAKDRSNVVAAAFKNKHTFQQTKAAVKDTLGADPVKKNASKMKTDAKKEAAKESVKEVIVDAETVDVPDAPDAPMPLGKDKKTIDGFKDIHQYLKDLDILLAPIAEEIAKHPAYIKLLESAAKDVKITTDKEYDAIVAEATSISEDATKTLQRLEGIQGVLKTSHEGLKNASWFT